MKAYVLFSGNNYYPSGGASDFVGYFDTHQDAIDAAESLEKEWQDYKEDWDVPSPKHDADWWHVAETATMGIVATKK
jgi:hypothetical protein